ncbi:hypothetical protein [Paracoccus luteus]|uniref:hypothetical protein n=1 Tax=Paracoccus luteus TaxID=2508543 RepID=UPI00106F4604|nr:hypothetical protein [Paracoccus luteus]
MTRDTDPPPDPPADGARPDRADARRPAKAGADRRAAALRANLARRKAQARSRAGNDDTAPGQTPQRPESED